MASGDDPHERPKTGSSDPIANLLPNQPSSDLPSQLRRMEEDGEDVAKTGGRDAGLYMHQSVFKMIPIFAGRGHSNFQSRFDNDPSESEEDREESLRPPSKEAARVNQTYRKKDTGNVSKSIAQLKMPRRKEVEEEQTLDRMSSSQILPPRSAWHATQRYLEGNDGEGRRFSNQAPVLSRKLTAEAEMEASQAAEPSVVESDELTEETKVRQPTSLPDHLQQIFKLSEPEEVITEQPCWFLQTVMLHGYMYITKRHMCFYAHLPKQDSEVTKSGFFAKRQRTRPRTMYRRFFFELRGDYLTYYTDSTKKIFPYGHIDLRNAISAAADLGDEAEGGPARFTLTTTNRDYHFQADSAESAKSWVKQLQRVLLRLSNDGDTVKICLPIENIVGVESISSLDFADTIKIQVVENQDSFAIDDFLFSFFGEDEEAYRVLRSLVEENSHHVEAAKGHLQRSLEQSSTDPNASSEASRRRDRVVTSPSELMDPELHGVAQTTISPLRSPSGRLTSDPVQPDLSARSYSPIRDGMGKGSQSSSRPHASTDSISRSVAQETESSAAIQSLDETDASASKMLEQSTLFHTPTVQRFAPSEPESSLQKRRGSDDTARSLELLDGAPTGRKFKGESHRAQGASSPSTQEPGNASTKRPSLLNRPSESNQPYMLRDLVRAGANPMQAASEVTQYLTKRSKDMSNLLASESMGYYEKVSGMWAGKRKHYGARQSSMDDDLPSADDEQHAAQASDRFRNYFALPESEQLQAIYFTSIQRVLPLYGKIYIGNKHFCFRSLIPGTKLKVVLTFDQIETVNKESGYRPGHPGVVVVIRGFEELFFEFSSKDDRDDCVVTLLQSLEQIRYIQASVPVPQPDVQPMKSTNPEFQLLDEARKESNKAKAAATLDQIPMEKGQAGSPIFFDDPRVSILNFKPPEALRITCLTIGSRGDVQPYIALCKGLIADGHKPCIATHVEFKDWILSHGVGFRPVAGDPAELMRICVENGMFTVNFLREATSKFRGWLDGLLVTAWEACQGTDLLIESPSAMAGVHIAEALGIPYMRAFSMPWTRTRAYPHAFAIPESRMGGYYNYMTYVMFDRVFWKAIAGQINSWRKKDLGLGSTNYDMLQSNKVPFLYFYSPSVVPPPADYSAWIRITGYWFLDVEPNYSPPSHIVDFVTKARRDGKKIVYIGFGSIVVDDPAALTQTVIDSVLKADVCCILSKGWSDRLGQQREATRAEVPLPSVILQIKGAPHDWLFKQIDAAVHHGGSGTTGASLRAGIPTIIKPFFGDQFFFGSRVEALGVGICLNKINVKILARALWEATHSQRMQVKARTLGERIRQEDGVSTAIQTIYRDLDYARTLSRQRNKRSDPGAADLEEETWTFIGDESEADMRRTLEEATSSKSSFKDLQHQRGVKGN